MVYCENHMTHTNPRCVPARKRITASYSAKTTAFIYTLKKKKDAAGFFDTPKLPTNYMVSLPSIQCRSKNEWTYTSFPPIRLHSMYREKHAFFLYCFISQNVTLQTFIVAQKPHVSFIPGLIIFINKEFMLIKTFK